LDNALLFAMQKLILTPVNSRTPSPYMEELRP